MSEGRNVRDLQAQGGNVRLPDKLPCTKSQAPEFAKNEFESLGDRAADITECVDL